MAKLRDKVKNALRQNLTEKEVVQVVIRGASSKAIVGTQTRAFVLKPGWMAGAAFGAEVTSWSYQNLGVQVHKGMMNGAVALQAAGQSGQSAKYWGQGDADPFKAPNAIPVAGEWNVVQAAAAVLRSLIDAAHNAPEPSAATSSSSIADELKKLGELRASGVLTEDEFVAAKQRLLG